MARDPHSNSRPRIFDAALQGQNASFIDKLKGTRVRASLHGHQQTFHFIGKAGFGGLRSTKEAQKQSEAPKWLSHTAFLVVRLPAIVRHRQGRHEFAKWCSWS
jgi:hypothetical protein